MISPEGIFPEQKPKFNPEPTLAQTPFRETERYLLDTYGVSAASIEGNGKRSKFYRRTAEKYRQAVVDLRSFYSQLEELHLLDTEGEVDPQAVRRLTPEQAPVANEMFEAIMAIGDAIRLDFPDTGQQVTKFKKAACVIEFLKKSKQVRQEEPQAIMWSVGTGQASEQGVFQMENAIELPDRDLTLLITHNGEILIPQVDAYGLTSSDGSDIDSQQADSQGIVGFDGEVPQIYGLAGDDTANEVSGVAEAHGVDKVFQINQIKYLDQADDVTFKRINEAQADEAEAAGFARLSFEEFWQKAAANEIKDIGLIAAVFRFQLERRYSNTQGMTYIKTRTWPQAVAKFPEQDFDSGDITVEQGQPDPWTSTFRRALADGNVVEGAWFNGHEGVSIVRTVNDTFLVNLEPTPGTGGKRVMVPTGGQIEKAMKQLGIDGEGREETASEAAMRETQEELGLPKGVADIQEKDLPGVYFPNPQQLNTGSKFAIFENFPSNLDEFEEDAQASEKADEKYQTTAIELTKEELEALILFGQEIDGQIIPVDSRLVALFALDEHLEMVENETAADDQLEEEMAELEAAA